MLGAAVYGYRKKSGRDHAQSVYLAFEAMSVHALLLQGPDHAFHHSVLLRMRVAQCNEFLFQVIAAHQPSVVATGEYQTVVRAQKERLIDPPQRVKAGDQCMFQCRRGRAGLAGAGGGATQRSPGMTVDQQDQAEPAILASPYAAQIRCPALFRYGGQ